MSFNSISVIQDNGRVIIRGCMQWSPMYGWKDSASSGS